MIETKHVTPVDYDAMHRIPPTMEEKVKDLVGRIRTLAVEDRAGELCYVSHDLQIDAIRAIDRFIGCLLEQEIDLLLICGLGDDEDDD